MIRMILLLTAFGIAFVSGYGLLSYPWVIGSLICAYVVSIIDEGGKVPGSDFRNMEDNDFGKSELNIKKATGIRVVYAILVFGIGYVLAQIVG